MVLCAMLAVACASSPPPPDRFYRMNVPAPGGMQALTGTVVVEPFEAHGIYAGRELLYARGGAIEPYFYQHWAEPPAVMMQDALVQYLRAALPRARVLTPSMSASPDYRIRARLRALEQRVDDRRAALAVEFTLLDAHGEFLGTLNFDDEAPLADLTVARYVEAQDALAAKAFAELTARLNTVR